MARQTELSRAKAKIKELETLVEQLLAKGEALTDQVYVEIQARMRLQGYIDRFKETDQASRILAERVAAEGVNLPASLDEGANIKKALKRAEIENSGLDR